MSFNRYRAFGVHLLVSMVIALLSAALVFWVWYPSVLAGATGVTQIFLILLAVDVIVGPCITLIVFNPAKRELRRDLAIVGLLQIAALLYGLHSAFVARPVYLVFTVDRFDLAYANDFTPEKLQKVTRPEFKTLPVFGPKTIAAESPSDAKARNEILLSSLTGGDDIAQLPQYYVPFDTSRAEVLKRLQPVERLRATNGDRLADVDALERRFADRPGGVGFLPLQGKVEDAAVIVGRETGQVLAIAPLSPW